MAVAGCQLLLMGLGGIERKFGGGGGGVRIDFLKSLTTLTVRTDYDYLVVFYAPKARKNFRYFVIISRYF